MLGGQIPNAALKLCLDPVPLLMQKACKVHDMASVTDYRRLAHHHRGLFFTDEKKEEELQARFQEVAQPHPTRPLRVDVIMGRTLDVAQAGKQPFLPLLLKDNMR